MSAARHSVALCAASLHAPFALPLASLVPKSVRVSRGWQRAWCGAWRPSACWQWRRRRSAPRRCGAPASFLDKSLRGTLHAV